MEKNKTATLLLWGLLGVLVVTCAVLAPGTLSAYQALTVEQNATPTPTADNRNMLAITPDPNSTPTPTVMLLKIGTQGDEVQRLQERLKELGYYTGEVDGQYGQGTAQAVILFQNQHGISGDGVAGEQTRALVYAADAEIYVPTPEPSATPSVLSMGDDNGAVKAMQQRLKELGYLSGNVDGDFGAGTKAAVALFQEQNGLNSDGIAAEQTLSLLFSDAAKQAVATPTPDPNAMPILVNRTHTVDASYQAADLVKLKDYLSSDLVTVKGDDIQGNRTAADALTALFTGAKEAGITGWQISAGYRSLQYQQTLFDKQVAEYQSQGMSKAKAVSATSLTVAEPGASEHHTGLAFDITVADTTFKGTEQQKWLAKNCWNYGFIIRYQEDKEDITGFLAECWHIRYVGVTHSVAMRDQNLCLEEYLGEV
ncbi:MAG: peptidoglycan-binding protein [Eubacteriales bacterium]|nr:peptidoglycan-binding protein [Eubacteriales bacterium]